MLLNGKRVIVTGGVTGIGRATVIEMVAQGASVVSMSRTVPNGAKAISLKQAAEAVGQGFKAHLQLDVTDEVQVGLVFDKAADILGGLDVLVHSAAVPQWGVAESLTTRILAHVLSVNVIGAALTNSAAFRYMKEKGGSIINYASYAGVCGKTGMSAYSASKGAVIAYSRTIAQEWGAYNIRVNIVCPGAETEMAEEMAEKMTAAELAANAEFFAIRVPLTGKLGTAEDSAKVNIFLASDMSKFITGQLIGVDGGLTMGR